MISYVSSIYEKDATNTMITDGEFRFLAIISLCMTRYGFCQISNEQFGIYSSKTTECIRRYIKKLKKLEVIFIENEGRKNRKIWIVDSWFKKTALIEAYGHEPYEEDFVLSEMD